MKSAKLCLNLGLIIILSACSGKGNIDLSKATPIGADPVKGSGPNGTYNPATDGDTTQYASLFSYQPGQVVNRKAGAVIDQTGTSLNEDYDGDGIKNNQEIASSLWVADYARVEASIAPPVTMTIAIEKSSSGSTDQISNDITSDDFEDNRDKGTENIHRNEMGVRTTQIQDKYSGSSESSHSVNTSESSGFSANAGGGNGQSGGGGSGGSSSAGGFASKGFAAVKAAQPMSFSLSGGGKSSSSSGSSYAQASSFNKTVTTFPDAPATNNLDRDAWSVKSTSAAKNARKYRNEKSTKVNQTSIVRPDAGVVRAALYIKNFSVNMPVKLSNILCTLMFETPTGQLIPMQSFRLRNDDFSLFTVNLYGGSEFGPYVIELTGLNTNEVENAIKLGYNPKIFIVDYDMSHVPNSNYKAALPGVIGDNVKIVEENAKGRTALIKVKGQGVREMYRVSAFSLQGATDPCQDNGGNYLPGVSLENVLKRLNCARANNQLDGVGTDFEAGDYIIDLSDVYPNLPAEKIIMVHGIKQLAGIQTNVPCKTTETNKIGTDGVTRSVCRVKKVSEMTTDELNNFGMWIVFANGKYYSHSDYVKTVPGGLIDARYDNTNLQSEKMLRGVSSIVWAGDNYDLIYVSLTELINLSGRYGSNPLETNASLALTTKWDASQIGGFDQKYQPDRFSVFLGKAAKDDMVELTFDLKSNKKLDLNFIGPVQQPTTYASFDTISYNLNTLSTRFDLQNSLQFEVNFGFGGNKSDWADITDTAKLPPCNGTSTLDASIDFVAQRFVVCFKVPASAYDYTSSGTPALQNIYLRPKLLDEYRNVIWPEKAAEVRKFKAILNIDTASSVSTIQVANVVGNMAAGDLITIGTFTQQYQIQTITPDAQNASLINLTITPPLAAAQKQFDTVKAVTAIGAAQVTTNIGNTYYADWNAYLAPLTNAIACGSICTFFTDFATTVTEFLGLNYNKSNLDWVGHNLFENDVYDQNVIDASKYSTFLDSNFYNLMPIPGTGNSKLWLDFNAAPALSVTLPETQTSTSNANDQNIGGLKTFTYENRALTLWYYRDGNASTYTVSRLMGRMRHLVTGAQGSEFVVASVLRGSGDETIFGDFAAEQAGSAIYLTWQATSTVTPKKSVKFAKIEMTSTEALAPVVSNAIALDASDSPNVVAGPKLTMNGTKTKAYVGFNSFDGQDAYKIVPINISGTTPVMENASFLPGGGNSIIGADISADNEIVFSYALNYDNGSGQIFSVIDMWIFQDNAGTLQVLNVQRLSQDIDAGFITQETHVKYIGKKAFVTWETAAMSGITLHGAIADFSDPSWIPSYSYYNFDANSGESGKLNAISQYGSQNLLVSWYSIGTGLGAELKSRKIDLSTNTVGSDVTVDTGVAIPSAVGANGAMLTFANGTALASYTKQTGVSTSDFVFKKIPLNTLAIPASATKINQGAANALNGAALFNPAASSFTDVVFSWVAVTGSTPSLQSNRLERTLTYGLNNFFTAPLIERNYTVTAKLR